MRRGALLRVTGGPGGIFRNTFRVFCWGARDAARPPPAEMLRRQGIHPHPGPAVRKLHSILNDEYWERHGWKSLEVEEPVGTISRPQVFELSDEQEIIKDCTDEEDEHEGDSGFLDWYGSPSSQDHLCRGRREGVLGAAWLDEAVYRRPPLYMLQAALSSNTAQSSEDPSCRKLMR